MLLAKMFNKKEKKITSSGFHYCFRNHERKKESYHVPNPLTFYRVPYSRVNMAAQHIESDFIKQKIYCKNVSSFPVALRM